MTDTVHRLAVLDDYQRVAESYADWGMLRDRGVEVEFFHAPMADRAAVIAGLADFDAVVAMRERTAFDRAVLAALPRLRLLITTGMANASIDMDAAAAAGVTVCGTGGEAAGAPELTWALLLAALRRLPEEQHNLREGRWQGHVGRSAEGLALGIVGLGRIGTRIARYAHAFGMDVLAWSPHLTEERASAAEAQRVGSLDELCERSDAVTIHMRLAPETHGLIGAKQLAQIGPDGILVNTSRAGLVDTAALVAALHDGRLGGAAIDVFDVEPVPPDAPILRAPRTVLSPHIGFVTRQGYARNYADAVQDVIGYLDGTPPRRIV